MTATTTASASAPNPASTGGAIPRGAIALLSLAAFCSGLSLRLTDPMLPMLGARFGVSIGQIATIVTSFSVAYGLSQLFFGPVGDRFGKYRVVAWACVACALTASACGLAQTFSELVVARLFAGATAAAIIPLSMAWIGDVVPYAERQPVLARFLIGQILGLSAGVFIGGFSVDHLPWQAPFFGIGLTFVAIGAGLFTMNRRLPESARLQHRAEGNPVARMLSEFSQVLAVKWARVVLLSVFLEGALLYGAFAFLATHVHLTFGVPMAAAGSMVMFFGFGGLLFAIASASLVRRLGEVGLTSVGGALLAASLASVGLVPVWWWAIPGCFVAGLGFYMLHNTLQINATQMAPERRGAAVSAFSSCFYMGQSLGVASFGALVARLGTAGVIVVGGAGVLAVGFGFSRLRALRAKAQAPA
jgi:predicted MFS family arabinose efflux permease